MSLWKGDKFDMNDLHWQPNNKAIVRIDVFNNRDSLLEWDKSYFGVGSQNFSIKGKDYWKMCITNLHRKKCSFTWKLELF